ncbi:hypothetical protein RYD26_12185 [Pasteurellaceae bacterium LIM206]|nr:hypothetical protein [Pasteurellaceae bacterium LIM206]
MLTKRELLFRKNQSRLYIENYLLKIQSLIKKECKDIEFLPLETTYEIREKLLGKKRNGKIIDFQGDELNKIISKIKEDQGEFYVFIDDDWKYCGCFLIDSLEFINDDFSLGKITDSIQFIDKQFTRRIELDFTVINNNFEIEYSDFKFS